MLEGIQDFRKRKKLEKLKELQQFVKQNPPKRTRQKPIHVAHCPLTPQTPEAVQCDTLFLLLASKALQIKATQNQLKKEAKQSGAKQSKQ